MQQLIDAALYVSGGAKKGVEGRSTCREVVSKDLRSCRFIANLIKNRMQ